MFKAILFGLLSCALVLPVFGLVISQFLPPVFVAPGEPGWRQQHNQLVSLNSVQWLTVLGVARVRLKLKVAGKTWKTFV